MSIKQPLIDDYTIIPYISESIRPYFAAILFSCELKVLKKR